MRIDGVIYVGREYVSVSALSGPRGAGYHEEKVALLLNGDAQHPNAATVRDALTRCLLQAGLRRRFFSPYLRVLVADIYARSAILAFEQLPRRAADKALLVEQRFCRQNRIDSSSVGLSFAAQPAADGERHVIVSALPVEMLNAISQCLRERRLYADFIVIESLFFTQTLWTHLSPPPALLVFFYGTSAAVVLRNHTGLIVHVAAFAQHERGDEEFRLKVLKNLERYALSMDLATGSGTIDIVDFSDLRIGESTQDVELPCRIRLLRHELGYGSQLSMRKQLFRSAA